MKVSTSTEIIIEEKDILEAVWYYIHSKRDSFSALDKHHDTISKMKLQDISFRDTVECHDIIIRVNQ